MKQLAIFYNKCLHNYTQFRFGTINCIHTVLSPILRMLQSSGETQMIHKRRRLLPRQPQSLFDDLIFSVSLKQHLVINRLQKSGHRFYMEELNIKRESGEHRQPLTRDSTFNVNKKWGDIFRDWNKSTGLPEHRAFFTGCVYVCVRVWNGILISSRPQSARGGR